MLQAAITFFVLGILAYLLGSNGVAGISLELGRMLLIVFVILSVISIIARFIGGNRNNKSILSVTMAILIPALGALAPYTSSAQEVAPAASTVLPGYVGGLLGIGVIYEKLAEKNPNSTMTFGLEGGAKLMPNFLLTAFATYHGRNRNSSIFGIPVGSSTRTYHLAISPKFTYSILHGGLDIGTRIETWSANAGSLDANTSNSELIYGPTVGIDIPIGTAPVSVGADGHLLFPGSGDGDSTIHLLASVKIWFK